MLFKYQMRPSSLFEYGSVALNPSPNGGVIHPQVSLVEKLLESEYRRYQRTAPRMILGAKCRHLKIGPSAMIVGW
jgi:hypothetical protein